MTVTGTDSNWTNNSELEVGGNNNSQGIVMVQSGGSVSSDTATVARDANSNGMITVSGAGSTWTNNSALTIGKFGRGTMVIGSGGSVASGTSVISESNSFGGNGSVTVSGTDSSWTDSGDLAVGDAGTGTMMVDSLGHVSNVNGLIGKQSGATGSVTVSGSSTWTNSGALDVGAGGTGTLMVESGGHVTNTGAFIANDVGSNGSVTIDGTNSTWVSSFGLAVGNHGTGTLDITAGGFVSSLNGHIGSASGSSGTVTVSGADSKWLSTTAVDFDFNVGRDGEGTLLVQNGGAVESTSAVIGLHVGSQGTATVNGSGSTWTNHGASLIVGFAGTGTLNITGGGAVADGNGFLGSAGAAVGTVTVDGSGSTWTNSGDVAVGGDGSGTLNITSGGAVADTNGAVNALVGLNHPPAEVLVDGANSIWTSTDNLTIGGILCPDCGSPDLEGRLTIRNGGQVTDTNAFLGSDPGSIGMAIVGSPSFGTPPPNSTWSSQFLSLGGDAVSGGGEGGIGELTILSHGIVSVAHDTVLFSQANLRLQGGTLDSAGISDQGGGVFDFLGGILHVETFLGDLVNHGGTLAPGHSAGRTTISGNYTQQAGARLDIEIGGTTFGSDYDEVEVTGAATLDGTLRLSLLNDFIPDATNSFVVLAAGSLSAHSAMSRTASVSVR